MRRRLAFIASLLGGMLVVLLLYIGFADLGRHKTRIERLLTGQVGRPITIAGPLHIRVLPSPTLVADGVRMANASGLSGPPIVEVGHFATRIAFWSLIRGPVRIKTLEVADVKVLLERGPAGENNPAVGDAGPGGSQSPGASGKAQEPAPDVKAEEARLPAVLEDGRFRNVTLTYRQPGRRDHVVAVDDMTVATRTDGLLAMRGRGHLDAYDLRLEGQVGPLDALLSGKDIRMALQSGVGNVSVTADGRLSLGPLDGADLKLNVQSPEVSGWLEDFDAPPVASGPLAVEAKLADAGERTALDVAASVGDLGAKVTGTLETLAFAGSVLDVEATVADVARIAEALAVKGVKPGALRVGARVTVTPSEIRAQNVVATLNDAEVKADAVLSTAAELSQRVRFDVSGPSLAALYDGLPAVPFGARGTYSGTPTAQRVPDLETRFGKSDAAGSVSVESRPRVRVVADLRSRTMDLTPFMTGKAKAKPKQEEAPPAETQEIETQEIAEPGVESAVASLGASARAAGAAAAGTAPDPGPVTESVPPEPTQAERTEATPAAAVETLSSPTTETPSAETEERADSPEAAAVAQTADQPLVTKNKKGEYVFSDAPLAFDTLATADVDFIFRAKRLRADTTVLTDVETRLTLEEGRLQVDAKGNGVAGGTAVCGLQLTPSGKTAALQVRMDVRELKAGLLSAEGADPALSPASSLAVDLRTKGGSARSLATGANGTLLFIQSPGEMKTGIVDMFGSDLLSKIGGSLNPFGAKDKTTKLDCTVARVDVVDGKVTIEPGIMQSEKVVITASGEVDLHTEGLKFKFNSKPRSGLGLSLSLLTNAITELGGTLLRPLPGIGAVAKGGLKGALGVLTAGLSVAADGLANRISGEGDRCADALAKAQAGPAAMRAPKPEPVHPDNR
jgi:uncharacterized protein involved in outer membrane biogenesis